MTDRLVLLGGGVTVELNDGLPLRVGRGYDLGAPDAETFTVQSVLVDGDVVVGERSRNRRLQIPVQVAASNRQAAVDAVADIAKAVDQPTFQLRWEPDNGLLPVVFDCYRGQVSQDWSMLQERQGNVAVVIDCAAAPFARNPDPLVMMGTLGAGAAGGALVDANDSLTTPATSEPPGAFTRSNPAASVTAPALSTTRKTEGTASVFRSESQTLSVATNQTVFPRVTDTRRFVTAQNFSTYAAFSVDLAVDSLVEYSSGGNAPLGGTFTVTVSLESAAGSQTHLFTIPGADGLFRTFTCPLANPTSTSGTFNPAAVTQYTMAAAWDSSASRDGGANENSTWTVTLFHDNARGASSVQSNGTRELRFQDIRGTGRSPAEVEITSSVNIYDVLLARYTGMLAGFSALAFNGTGSADAAASDGTAAQDPVTVERTTVQYRPGAYLAYLRVRDIGGTGKRVRGRAYVTVNNVANGTERFTTPTVTSAPLVGTDYQLVFLGEFHLPPLGVAGGATAARFFLLLEDASGGSGQLRIDEVYLFPSDAEVVHIDGMPAGTRSVVITAPNADTGQGGVFAGSTRQTAVAVTDAVRSLGLFHLTPGDNAMMLVADPSNAQPTLASVTASYYPRWHFARTT